MRSKFRPQDSLTNVRSLARSVCFPKPRMTAMGRGCVETSALGSTVGANPLLTPTCRAPSGMRMSFSARDSSSGGRNLLSPSEIGVFTQPQSETVVRDRADMGQKATFDGDGWSTESCREGNKPTTTSLLCPQPAGADGPLGKARRLYVENPRLSSRPSGVSSRAPGFGSQSDRLKFLSACLSARTPLPSPQSSPLGHWYFPT
jgi:hypothetical protein